MSGLRALGLAGCVALCSAGSAGAEPDPAPLRLAQGFDINDLLKGGPPSTGPTTDLPMRGLPPPPEAATPVPVAALPPVAAFPASVLAGRWTGIGAACAERLLDFQPSSDGYTGVSTWVDPVDGYRITTRFDATSGTALPGAPHPADTARYFSFARQYAARVTRRDGSGAVVGLVEDIPVTLLVSTDATSLVLRIVEPVTDCRYARPGN